MSEFGTLACPTGEEAEEGETISCFSIETGEPLDCLVLLVIDEGEQQFLLAHCTPADDPPGGGNGGGGNGNGGGDNGGGGGGQQGGGVEITQEGEQESESSEIDQTFDVS